MLNDSFNIDCALDVIALRLASQPRTISNCLKNSERERVKPMKRHLTAMTVVLACGGSFSPLASQEAVPGSVTALAADIVGVEAGGYWSSGSTEGFYRAVVTSAGVEHVNNSIYLQWVKVNLDDATYEIASSVPINEINVGHTEGYLIDVTRDKEAEIGSLLMTVTVNRARSGDTITYQLTADGQFGKYKLARTN